MFAFMRKITIKVASSIIGFCLSVYRALKPEPERIYFCYNQSVHHIYHSLFIAIELSRCQNAPEVTVLSTSCEASGLIERELAAIPNNVHFIRIKHPWYGHTGFNVNWFVLLCRLCMHRPKAVVVSDYYDNVFRRLGVRTRWIYTFHGPENRGYTDPHIKDYDLILVPGPGELERLEEKAGKLDNYLIAGYSKFDFFHYHEPVPKSLFQDSKPVVLYNPHFDPSQSSFFDAGLDLLEELSRSGKYNVIFMPHPDLARKHPKLVRRATSSGNITLATRNKINLEYMACADIYITDVSSSAFEWLYFDKPVLFFNTKKGDRENESRYPVWACGKVLESVPSMLEAVFGALTVPEEFGERRRDMFKRTFANTEDRPSVICARAITAKLEKEQQKGQFFYGSDLGSRKAISSIAFSVASAISRDMPFCFIAAGADLSLFENGPHSFKRVNTLPFKRILSCTPLRWHHAWFTFFEWALFDLLASRHLEPYSPVYAQAGTALHIFKKAGKNGLLRILYTNSLHIDFVWELHRQESEITGFDDEWLGEALRKKILLEYEIADEIIMPSRLALETFLAAGIRKEKLRYMPVKTDHMPQCKKKIKTGDIFCILYVGRFTPQKGIHYLIKAFKELALPGTELMLFGAAPTRKLARWVNCLVQGSTNIFVQSGDVRQAYEQADVLVQPSLNDAWSRVVAEALACGLAVILTENTGSKELIREGENGYVIPIRDVGKIKEKIMLCYRSSREGRPC